MNFISRQSAGVFLLTVFFISTGGIQKTQAQILYKNSLSLATGIYSSEGIGANPYAGLRYNHYLAQGKHFAEITLGLSSVESTVLQSTAGLQLFDGTRLVAFEIVYGYDPAMWSSVPYFVFGVANVNQGGQNKYAGVIGIGNRIHFDTLFGSKKIGLRYDFRDHILKQKFSEREAFIAHNLVLSLNLDLFL
jgi:hypothetical protein